MPGGKDQKATRARSLSAPASFLPPIGAALSGGAAHPMHVASLPGISAPTIAALPVLPSVAVSASAAGGSGASAALPLSPVADASTGRRARSQSVSQAAAPVRRSGRDTSVASTQATEARSRARSAAPARAHPTSGGRALEPIAGASTAQANDARLALAAPSTPNSRPVMVVYGGQPSPGGHLQGMPLGGSHIDRGSWTQDQKNLSHRLGAMLAAEGHSGAPHKGGVHHSEIAHHRQQATGGFTDSAGAVPASTGSNIQDMAYEESHAKIAQSLPSNQVREVNIASINAVGPDAGTLNSRTRDLFARSDTTGAYHLAQHQLQDGQRDMPDKKEVRALREAQTAAALHAGSGAMPAVASSSGVGAAAPKPSPFAISATASPTAAPSYTGATKNNSGASDYMSAIRSPQGAWRTGEDAAEWHASFNHYAAQGHARPAAAASVDHADTGSRRPPFIAPPSPLVFPSIRAGAVAPATPTSSPVTPPRATAATAATATVASVAADHVPAAPSLQRRKTF